MKFRCYTSKSFVDNKYKFCYTIITIKVGGRQSRNEGATSDPNGIVLKGKFSKTKPIFIERTKTERRKNLIDF